MTIPVPGIYLIFMSLSLNYTTPPTQSIASFNGTTSTASTLPTFICGLGNEITANAGSLTTSVPANITTAGTVVLRFDVTGTITTITILSYSAVRIA